MPLADKLIDKRVQRRYLDRGVISKAEFAQYLSELPDRSANVVKTDVGDGPIGSAGGSVGGLAGGPASGPTSGPTSGPSGSQGF